VNLFITKANIKHRANITTDDYPNYLSHEAEPVGLHQKNNTNRHSHLHDFFDGVYVMDRYLLCVAEAYLKK